MKKIVKILIIILGISNAFASNPKKQLGVYSLDLIFNDNYTSIKIDINQLIHKRWWSIDPKATASESMYSSMGNNPILNTDILGDVMSNALLEKTNRVFNLYDNKISDFKEALAKVKETDIEKKDILSFNLKILIDERNQFDFEISALKNSNVNYDLGDCKDCSASKIGGNIYYENGSVMLGSLNYAMGGNEGNTRHEFKHLYQFDVGQISFNKEDNGIYFGEFYDLYDELDAYYSTEVLMKIDAYYSTDKFKFSNSIENLKSNTKYNFLSDKKKDFFSVFNSEKINLIGETDKELMEHFKLQLKTKGEIYNENIIKEDK